MTSGRASNCTSGSARTAAAGSSRPSDTGSGYPLACDPRFLDGDGADAAGGGLGGIPVEDGEVRQLARLDRSDQAFDVPGMGRVDRVRPERTQGIDAQVISPECCTQDRSPL